MNPAQMRTAGTPGAYAGIIRARGRVSGRMIETPVGIIADGDAFLIALKRTGSEIRRAAD